MKVKRILSGLLAVAMSSRLPHAAASWNQRRMMENEDGWNCDADKDTGTMEP